MKQANAKAGEYFNNLPVSENIGRMTVIRAYLAGHREGVKGAMVENFSSNAPVSGQLLADYDWELLNQFKVEIYELMQKPPFKLEHAQHGIACEKLGDLLHEFWKKRHGK